MEVYGAMFDLIDELVRGHSPSGVEDEVDGLLRERFASLGMQVRQDASGNLIARIPGRGAGSMAIAAHKDEIGAIVTEVQDGGRVRVRKLGGSYPWVYGEGVVDLLGDVRHVSGILSFGSRHVSHLSPQRAQQENAPLRWQDAWIETKLCLAELAAAGVRAGTRMVVGKHRKAPFRLGDHIASYALDNKASLAVLLELARIVKEPLPDVYLVASSKEEVGCIGASYFTQRHDLDVLIALDICPIAPEYSVADGVAPVLVAEDGLCLYDDSLNSIIRSTALERDIPLQEAVLSNFGSDASAAIKGGHVARGACIGFPAQNTHGYEIAHLGAIENCVRLLEALCHVRMPDSRHPTDESQTLAAGEDRPLIPASDRSS